MTRPRLIINADDFGWSRSINRAVAEAHDNGAVASTSLMAGGPAFEEAARLAAGRPGLGVGLHLNLTQGAPQSQAGQVPSLCDGRGAFLSRSRLLWRSAVGLVRPAEVARELAAQYEKLISQGIRPTHLDGHQHIHVLPLIRAVAFSFAQDQGLAVRIPLEELIWAGGGQLDGRELARVGRKLAFKPRALQARAAARRKDLAMNDHFRSPFGLVARRGRIDRASFGRLLENLRPGVTELMVHPALDADAAALWDNDEGLLADRFAEARLLSDPAFKAFLAQLGVEMIHYGHLKARG